MHLNQQLVPLLEQFCAKLLGNCKEFDLESFSCATTQYLLGRHAKISANLLFGFVLYTSNTSISQKISTVVLI